MEYQEAVLDQIKPEIMSMLEQNFDEIAKDKGLPYLKPAWDMYSVVETMGKTATFVARKDGRIVGYAFYIISDFPHCTDLSGAFCDTLFVLPEYRGAAALKLLEFAASAVKERGIHFITASVSVRNDYSSLLEYLGYAEAETIFMKRLR